MPKYSLIITAYNAEKYIEKCLESILSQTFDDYEVIIVNDGSTDNTKDIINKYIGSKVKSYIKKNEGVSEARNYGISKVKGEYFLFVDADDYIDKNLLKIVNKHVEKQDDVLSFNIRMVGNNNQKLNKTNKPIFTEISGAEAIEKFIEAGELFDTPVAYIYKTKYFKEHKFKYAKGKYHEDFGLTPLVILYANKVSSIDNDLYYYVQSDNSITRTNNREVIIKRAYDMLYHFDYLYNNVQNNLNIDSNTKKIFYSFIANAIINKTNDLSGIDRKNYINELKKRHVAALVLGNNLKRLMKKILLYISINLYLKLK